MQELPRLRVVIAEDSYLVSLEIRRLLEAEGCEVVAVAADGHEALELVRRERPDVALLDIEMPGMDGLEAARRIHAECPTPVVILTAHDSPALVDEASEAGVGAYLVKPPAPAATGRALAIARARFADLQALREANRELADRARKLEESREHIEVLRGFLPICASCKRIRDVEGMWSQLETYIEAHSAAHFTHSLCPECFRRTYPELSPEAPDGPG